MLKTVKKEYPKNTGISPEETIKTILKNNIYGCEYDKDLYEKTLETIKNKYDLDEFEQHAEYNMNGAYQAGSVLNNLAIHARDSVPIMGIPVNSAASADPDSRQVSVVTVWNKYDIDGDGERS